MVLRRARVRDARQFRADKRTAHRRCGVNLRATSYVNSVLGCTVSFYQVRKQGEPRIGRVELKLGLRARPTRPTQVFWLDNACDLACYCVSYHNPHTLWRRTT